MSMVATAVTSTERNSSYRLSVVEELTEFSFELYVEASGGVKIGDDKKEWMRGEEEGVDER